MKRPAAFSQAWWLEWGLSAMLVFFALAIFVGLPLETLGLISPTAVGVAITLLFVSGVVAMAGRGWVTYLVGAAAFASLAVRWATEVWPGRVLIVWDMALGILALALLTAFILRQVFRAGPITGDRIRGAILVYLLIALVWCVAYQLVDFLSPGAFRFPDQRLPAPGRLSQELAYYSFITLTTVGYGDITPVSPVARTLSVVEALIGQLYPAILIGRLISLQISSRPGGEAR
ncbi:MAG: potassium channel family protein [Syntrophomonadaceae bacterium]